MTYMYLQGVSLVNVLQYVDVQHGAINSKFMFYVTEAQFAASLKL